MIVDVSALGEWLYLLTTGNPDGLVTMLHACVDESGTHQKPAALCVALCAARPDPWKTLLLEWAKVAPLDYHAARARPQVNLRLASLMQEHLGRAVVVSLDLCNC